MDFPSDSAASRRWLPRIVVDCPPRAALAITLAVALAIRLYLSLTSYCIAGDGVAYLAMARDFAAGAPTQALDAVFSPLYPWLIAVAHLAVPGWEMAGNLVSAIAGTAAVATIYALTRAAFARDDLAIGAAILAAIDPELAAYSASVRTEAGFILWMTAAAAVLVLGLRGGRLRLMAAAGALGGIAYLYRTEGIGMLVFGTCFIVAGAPLWRRWTLGWAIRAAALFAAAFLLVASPYLIYLRVSQRHWSIGREFTAAMMYGMGEVAHNTQQWQLRGYSTQASPLAPLFEDPRLYMRKVAGDFLASLYGFAQALGPIAAVLLALGWWSRGRALMANFAEAMLLLLTAFYVCGFSLSYTGTRFMVHLIPYTFGWIMLGLEALSGILAKGAARARWIRYPASAPAVVLALAMLPQTLWPIGYDMRGIRYAGDEIARRTARDPAGGRGAVVAADGRVAYYADARLILLPAAAPPAGLCQWLGARTDAGYLLIGDRDERRMGGGAGLPCLVPIARYPRYGAGFYDLFSIRRAG